MAGVLPGQTGGIKAIPVSEQSPSAASTVQIAVVVNSQFTAAHPAVVGLVNGASQHNSDSLAFPCTWAFRWTSSLM